MYLFTSSLTIAHVCVYKDTITQEKVHILSFKEEEGRAIIFEKKIFYQNYHQVFCK